MEYHTLVASSWHPIWMWHELKFWQWARGHFIFLCDEAGIAECDMYIDKYCDFIEQRVYTWPPYTFGYEWFGYSIGYNPIDK